MKAKGSLKLGTFRCGTPRAEGEGLRIGAVRYLPRGMKKEDYAAKDYFDVWLPAVSPSAEAIRRYREKGPSADWSQFAAKYASEMRKSTDGRQAVLLIAEIAKRTPVSLGCYCEDEARCHRSVLKKLVEDVARGSFP